MAHACRRTPSPSSRRHLPGPWHNGDELGDTLWYVAVLADHFGLPFEDIAERNIRKLADRQQRGAIGGSGDDR